MFALGLASWLYSRPLETTERFLERKFASKPDALAANLTALRAGHGVRGDDGGLRRPLRGGARRAAARHVHEHHRQRRAGQGDRRRRAGWRTCPSSWPPTRSPPASDLLHALSRRKAYGVRTTLQLEDEIAAVGRGAGRVVLRGARGDDDVGPWLRAEDGDHRPGGHGRAAAARRRRAARRPVDRPADEGGAGRPAARAARPQLREPGGPSSPRRSPSDCFDAALEAARIAITYRDAGGAAERRGHRQRQRAVAAARRREPAGPAGAVRERR